MSDIDRARPFLSHDRGRSPVHRRREIATAGVCDTGPLLHLSLALWNRDPVLKDLLLGLSDGDGVSPRPAPAGRCTGRSGRPTPSPAHDTGEEAPR